MRRLRTEEWGTDAERRFLRALRLDPTRAPFVPEAARAYVVAGFVVHEVYAPFDNFDPRTYEVPRRWRLAYVGRAVRRLP